MFNLTAFVPRENVLLYFKNTVFIYLFLNRRYQSCTSHENKKIEEEELHQLLKKLKKKKSEKIFGTVQYKDSVEVPNHINFKY